MAKTPKNVGKYEPAQKKKKKFRLSRKDKRIIKRVAVYLGIASIPVLLAVVPMTVRHHKDVARFEEEKAVLVAQHEEDMAALRAEHRAEIDKIYKDIEYGEKAETVEKEAEYVAKVVYGTAKDHSINDQKTVVWCILNRVDNPNYPNSVKEVCEQPKQWMAYSDDNPVMENIYNIALEILKSWHNDMPRPISADYVFMSWSSKEISLRNTYVESKDTRYWRVY